jgi:membrane associated rhomboid family serine protease
MENRLRNYTRKRLKKVFFGSFFNTISVTNWIIIANVIVFFIIFFLVKYLGEDTVASLFALQANEFFAGKIWNVFTSMFIHFQLWHLLANMFSLFFIGNFVERLIGRKRFFSLYIIAGLFAGLFYVFLAHYFGISLIGARLFGSPETYAVGASGAIFSLLGLLAVLTPLNSVYLIVGPLVALVLQAVLSSVISSKSILSILDLFLSLYILISIFSVFSFNEKIRRLSFPVKMKFWILPVIAIVPLILIGLFIDLPIGNSAHLGGLIVGLIFALYLKKKYKKKTALISKYFSR